MPEVIRGPVRMVCGGIDLVHPVDRMPESRFPYIINGRVVEEGRIESRPGYTTFSNLGSGFHSIRRLNDEDSSIAGGGYIYLVGGGADLYAGDEAALVVIDTGYSGDPLSLVTFRPEQSSESWMYVYDRTRMRKVSVGQTVRPIGVEPPLAPLGADYWRPASVDIQTCQGGTAGWIASGAAGAAANSNRVTTGTTIGTILYNGPPPTVIGTTNNWCVINPSTAGDLAWAGERMKVTLDSGGANQEEVFVREIHPAVNCGSIDSILYDAGATGLCSVVFTQSPPLLARNSMLQLNAEVVRVLAVVPSPDGNSYSIRCLTTGTHAAGEAVTGLVSWYVFTENTHAAGETITSNYISSAIAAPAGATTIAALSKLAAIDAGRADNQARPISIADDYLHISFFASAPQNIISLKLRLDVDAQTAALVDAFTRNYFEWTIAPDQINNTDQTVSPTGGVWTEIIVPLSSSTRFGGDPARSLANIMAVQVEVAMTSNLTNIGFDWWYLHGTYGPDVPLNSPTGLVYITRFREDETGAASVPGQPSRYELFPLREGIIVTPDPIAATTPSGALIDIYRQGGGLPNPTYVGTIPATSIGENYLIDELPDSSVAANPQADFTQLQPWPILDYPWAGFVNTSGTTVTWVSGSQFNLNLLSNMVIKINGTAYQTYGQPSSATRLELFKSAGTQINVPFEVESPTLAAQPLPYAFMLEGPFLPVVFGLGDPKNPGTLYYTNPGNLDGASDENTLELAPPGEPLISGESWNGLALVGSRDNKFLVRYSYRGPGEPPFQFSRLPSLSGMWSRWACCRGLDGIYSLGRDGIYRTTEQGDVSVTDQTLYPMFPHDGEPAKTVRDVAPVDMTQLTRLRLTAADQDIYFDYVVVGQE